MRVGVEKGNLKTKHKSRKRSFSKEREEQKQVDLGYGRMGQGGGTELRCSQI